MRWLVETYGNKNSILLVFSSYLSQKENDLDLSRLLRPYSQLC
jgi:hypothetical protein